MSLADTLTPLEAAAVEAAYRDTFAQTEAEHLAAEIAVWRVMHVDEQRQRMLARVAAEAIRAHRADSRNRERRAAGAHPAEA